jgi:GNAT superfamily N-acetyltransferase
VPERLTIRRATPDDAADVAALAAKTFFETFAADNRPEDMAAHLATAYGVAQQSAEIADPDYVTLLAFADDALAAFAQVRRKTPPPCVTGDGPIEIHRFYVDQRWHGQGDRASAHGRLRGGGARLRRPHGVAQRVGEKSARAGLLREGRLHARGRGRLLGGPGSPDRPHPRVDEPGVRPLTKPKGV